MLLLFRISLQALIKIIMQSSSGSMKFILGFIILLVFYYVTTRQAQSHCELAFVSSGVLL